MGLRQHGQDAEADEILRSSLRLVDRGGFHEYFDPFGGAAFGTDGFGWTAALTLDVIERHQGADRARLLDWLGEPSDHRSAPEAAERTPRRSDRHWAPTAHLAMLGGRGARGCAVRCVMHAIVVYESHWGNTAAVAWAIGEGIGPETEVLTTDAVTPAQLDAADLVIAGAPTMAFRLPTDAMLKHVADDPKAPVPGDVSHPSLRSWLEALPEGPTAVSAGPPVRGRFRDGAALVTRRRQGLDRQGPQAGWVPPGGRADAVLRRGQLRPAPRRRARPGASVGRGAGEGRRLTFDGSTP